MSGASHVVLPAGLDAPTRARRAVASALGAGTSDRLYDTVALLATELVTNAVRYGGGSTIGLSVGPGPPVRVEVADANPRHPARRRRRPERPGGRGLRLLDALADDWGVTDGPGSGKTVWFEVVDRTARPAEG